LGRRPKAPGPETSYIVSKVFIDTNVLVYSIDHRVPAKMRRARELLDSLDVSRLPVISTQVVQEFYVAATSKLKIAPLAAKKLVHSLRTIETVTNTVDIAEQAIDISVLSQISFWDSLIIAAAEKARCDMVLSEDLNSGQMYRGIKVIDPFRDKSFYT
jgi:predicted nucleic acid-binding protein